MSRKTFSARQALKFEEAWQRFCESAALADVKAARPGLAAAICRLARDGRKLGDHLYLRLEKRLKTVVLLRMRTTFKDEGLSVLVPKENKVEFHTPLGEHLCLSGGLAGHHR